MASASVLNKRAHDAVSIDAALRRVRREFTAARERLFGATVPRGVDAVAEDEDAVAVQSPRPSPSSSPSEDGDGATQAEYTPPAAAAERGIDDAAHCIADPVAYAGALTRRTRYAGLRRGHDNVRRIRWALENLGCTYTDSQVLFHDKMLYALLPSLYGERAWTMHQAEILSYHGLDRHTPRVAMSMPRSGGKTWSVVTFLAALLWATADQGLLVVCFSIQQAQSSWLLQKTYSCLCVLPGGARMCRMSGHELSVSRDANHRATKSPTATTLMAQSGHALGSRGLQPNCIVCEEAGFMNPDLFLRIIFPMLAHYLRAIICISSPGDPNGFFASLFRLRWPTTGELVFDCVKEENICADCVRARALTCPHLLPALPPWKCTRAPPVMP